MKAPRELEELRKQPLSELSRLEMIVLIQTYFRLDISSLADPSGHPMYENLDTFSRLHAVCTWLRLIGNQGKMLTYEAEQAAFEIQKAFADSPDA